MYLQLGMHRANPPFVRSERSPETNPLLDRRVRRAISMAIDRSALVEEVLRGAAEPAGQLVPEGFFGHVPGLWGDVRDVHEARQLLAEAGYPRGFELTLHGPQGVYPGDVQVLEAIARMLRDVGITARAVSKPAQSFAAQGSRQQYSAILRGFVSGIRDASVPLRMLVATYDADTGAGSLNWGRYSNRTLDGMLQRAMGQASADARKLLVQEATSLAMRDVALVPLYFTLDVSASRAGLALDTTPGTGPLASRVSFKQAGKAGRARR